MKKIIKYLTITSSIILLILLALTLLVYGWAHTPSGQETIIRIIEGRLNTNPETKFRIGKVSGIFPHINIDQITVSDKNGVFLEVMGLDTRVITSALPKRKMVLEHLTAKEIRVLRLPEKAASPQPANYFEPLGIFAAPPVIIRRLEISRITLEAPILGARQVYMLNGLLTAETKQLNLRNIEGTALETVLVATKHDDAWQHNLHVTVKDKDVFSGNFTLEPQGDIMGITAAGIVTLPDQPLPVQFSLDASANDEGEILVSPLNITYDKHSAVFSGTLTPQAIDGDLIGHVTLPDTISPQLLALTGKNLLVAGQVTMNQTNYLTALTLSAYGNNAILKLRSTLNLTNNMIDNGEYTIIIPEMTLQGTFSGELMKPHIVTDLKTTAIPYGTVQIPPMTGHLETSITDTAIHIFPIKISTENKSVTGKLDIDRATKLLSGKLEGDIPEITGLKIGKSSAITLVLKPENNKQSAQFTLDASDISLGTMHGRNAKITGNITDLFGAMEGKLNGTFKNITQGTFAADVITLSASGNKDSIVFNAASQGTLQEKYSLTAKGKGAFQPDMKQITLTELKGSYGKTPLALTRPALLKIHNTGFTLEETRLTYGKGTIIAKGKLADQITDILLTVNSIEIASLYLPNTQDIQGVINSKLHLAGKPSAPEGTGSITVKNLAYSGTRSNLPKITVTADATLKNEQLATIVKADLPSGAGATAHLNIPVTVSLIPFQVAAKEKSPISGRIDASLALESLPSLLLLDTQQMSGKVAANLTISGTMANPVLNGPVTVTNASYEHLVAGIALKNIVADIIASGEQLTIRQFSAADGTGGKLTGRGSISLSKTQQSPFSLAFDLQHFHLVRRDDLKIRSNGNIAIAGSMKEPTVTGKLTIEKAEFIIPDRSATKVSQLNITEINLPAGQKPLIAKTENAVIPVHLNLTVAIPRHAVLKGRGLTSEWKGNLAIGGMVSDPYITGSLQLVEGNLALIGRDFVLKNSEVLFKGNVPPSPYLDITAETTAEDITTQLKLSGSARNPEVALESIPPLPTEEIMSRLLFGQNLKNISPAQALRLAGMTQQLIGGKASNFNILDRTKDILGVDKVDVRQGDNGDTVLGVGKNIRENVYVGAEKGLGTEGAAVNIEVEVSPRITIDSRIGTDSKSGIGINWKKDY